MLRCGAALLLLAVSVAEAHDEPLAFLRIDPEARCTEQWRQLAGNPSDVRNSPQFSACMRLIVEERTEAIQAWNAATEEIRRGCADEAMDRDVTLRGYRALNSCLERKAIQTGKGCLPHLLGC